MTDCYKCKYAMWDCLKYYNTTQRQYFICGCRRELDLDAKECEEYEEVQE